MHHYDKKKFRFEKGDIPQNAVPKFEMVDLWMILPLYELRI